MRPDGRLEKASANGPDSPAEIGESWYLACLENSFAGVGLLYGWEIKYSCGVRCHRPEHEFPLHHALGKSGKPVCGICML